MSGAAKITSRAAQFGRVPITTLLLTDASDAACRLYAYLTTYDFARTGTVWPGRERAVEDLPGWSLRKLDRALSELDARGAIERKRGGRGQHGSILLLADELPDVAGQELDLPSVTDDLPNGVGASTTQREKNETSRGEPSSTAWRLARARLDRGGLLPQRADQAAKAVDAVLATGAWSEDQITEALAAMRGVRITDGALGVQCSKMFAGRAGGGQSSGVDWDAMADADRAARG